VIETVNNDLAYQTTGRPSFKFFKPGDAAYSEMLSACAPLCFLLAFCLLFAF